MKSLYLILFSFVFLAGCKHKPNFDSMSKVSYATDIEPIIISNCTQSGCHGSVHSEEFKLLTYNDVIKHTDVKAGSPESSNLYNVIRSYNSEKMMPQKPYEALTEKQIQKIFVWIGQGALNN